MELTVSEVADRLDVSSRVVRLWVASGRLPSRKVGHMSVVRESDLRRFKMPVRGRPKPKAGAR